MENKKLTKGWEMKKLKEVALTFGRGKSKHRPRNDENLYGGNYPFIQTGDVRNANKYISQYSQTYNELGLAQSKLWPKGTICITIAANIAETGILEFDSCFPDSMIGLVVDPQKANIDFAYYCLQFLKAELQLLGKGSAQANINMETFETQRFPFPSVKEQQHIVSILDEAFAAIDKAKENVLRNLQNAKELFQSELNSIFSNGEKDWDIKSLGNVCQEIFAGGDAPLKNISDTKTEKYKTPIFANATKYKGLYGYTDLSRVFEPSITIAARGSGTGYTEIRYEPFFPIVRLIVLTPNLEIVTLEFLKYSIQNLDILISGSAIPQLTVPMIKGYSIPFPSIKEQKKIVHQLDTLSIETKKLESLYQQKLNSLEELKKGILQKAFSGK